MPLEFGRLSEVGYFAVSVVPTVKLALIPKRYGDWPWTAALTFFQTNNPVAARNNGKNQQLVFTSGIGLNFLWEENETSRLARQNTG